MPPRPEAAAVAGDEDAGVSKTLITFKPSDITKNHIVVDNRVYDISRFAKEHPGGNVIFTYSGADATAPFHAFHRGSQTSYDLLASCCVGELDGKLALEKPFEKECRALAAKFHTDGLYKSSKLWYGLNLLQNAALVIVPAIIAVWGTESLWARVVCAVVMAVGWQQFGWTAHEFGHHQVFSSHALNDVVLLFCCVFIGFDRDWWSLKHNTHHALPNVHESRLDAHDGDPDIDTLPFLAWSKALARKCLPPSAPKAPIDKSTGTTLVSENNTPMARFLVARQHIVYFPLLAFARLTWAFQSFAYAFRVNAYWGATAPPAAKEGSSADAAGSSAVTIDDVKLRYERLQKVIVVSHWVWYAALLYALGLAHGTAFFFVSQCFCGLIMALAFAVGHNGMITYDAGEKPGFFELQVTTGRDVTPTFFNAWFMGGLHYQIEHHMYPTMPRHNLHIANKAVVALCAKHGIPHRTTGLWEGTVEVVQCLKEVAMELKDGPVM